MRKSFTSLGFKALMLFLLLGVMTFMSGPARADLTILPTRVIFEGRDRFADITLINTGNDTKTYSMGWEFFEMSEGTGAYISKEKPITDFNLAEHVVYSPRRVTLQPGEKQKIRLALRPPAEIAPGEYRAHFRFQSVREDPAAKPNDPNDNKMSAAVNINVGYSIPVVYSVGDSDAKGAIESMKLERDENGVLTATIPVTRSGGPYGLHGHLFVYHQPAGGGKEKLVGEISNAHVFPEIHQRIFKVKFSDNAVNGGNLRVLFRHFDKAKNLIYDEKIFPVGN